MLGWIVLALLVAAPPESNRTSAAKTQMLRDCSDPVASQLVESVVEMLELQGFEVDSRCGEDEGSQTEALPVLQVRVGARAEDGTLSVELRADGRSWIRGLPSLERHPAAAREQLRLIVGGALDQLQGASSDPPMVAAAAGRPTPSAGSGSSWVGEVGAFAEWVLPERGAARLGLQVGLGYAAPTGVGEVRLGLEARYHPPISVVADVFDVTLEAGGAAPYVGWSLALGSGWSAQARLSVPLLLEWIEPAPRPGSSATAGRSETLFEPLLEPHFALATRPWPWLEARVGAGLGFGLFETDVFVAEAEGGREQVLALSRLRAQVGASLALMPF